MSDDTRRIGPPRASDLSDSPTGQIRAPATLTIEAGGRTDKGRVRPGNEDAFGLEPSTSAQARAQGTLLIVSDGMGGHAAGEVASRLAVDTVQATYYRDHGTSTAEAIRSAIDRANSVIFENAEQNATRSGMGCTIVVMVVQGNTLTVGHVGDSRGYLIRGSRARQITRDHSWVAMQVEEGILTPEQAEHHPNRSLLMRALGRQPSVEVEINQHQLQAGDVLLLCSDGLTGVVGDAEIGEYASRYAPETAADQLVNLANQRGAPDNVTVVAAAITATAGSLASTTVTMAAPAADALTPRLVQPPASATTTPMPRTRAAASGPPAGTPIVLSRESATPRAGAPTLGRRGRGRWLAGSLAAFGLAAALVLLTTLGPRTAGDPEPTASKPAATSPASGQAAPAATVPPPLATGIPGLTAPGPGVAAAPPPPAAPQPPAATPTPALASKPGSDAAPGSASKPGTTPLNPGVAGIFATPTRPAGSPPALTAPTGVPTATSTPSTSGADTSRPGGAAGPSDAATGAGASSGAASPPDASAGASAPPDAAAPADGPADATGAEPNPEEGAPATGEAPGEGEPSAEAPEAPEAPPDPESQATPRPRFIPGTGIAIPDGFPLRPARRPSDD